MMKSKRHYFKDVAAQGYVTTDSRLSKQRLDKPTGTLLVNGSTQRSGSMDAVIAKGELLKANIAKMREKLKGRY